MRSGHGTGKSAVLARAIIWFMCCFPQCNIPCTAPSENQLRDVLWKEISRGLANLDPFYRDKFELTVDRMYHKDYPRDWFAVARTARKENPEALQGFHGTEDHPLLFVIDEASGVPEEIFEVVRGALTDEENRVIMCSNPTRTSGFFYLSHNSLSMWNRLQFNAEESPLVSEKAIKAYRSDYGEDSDTYRVRVKGSFPKQDDNTLIPLEWVEQAMTRDAVFIKKVVDKKFDSAGVDVARYGENKTAIALVKNITVVAIKMYAKTSTMKTAGMVANLAKHMNHDAIKVDQSGVGGGVIDRLEEQNIFVVAVDNGSSAIDKVKFANRRSELYWHLREIFETGAISLKGLRYTMDHYQIEELKKQLTSLKFEYNSSGKIQVWTKEKMRREKIKSPDMADALCLAFADYTPESAPKPKPTETQRLLTMLESDSSDEHNDVNMGELDAWDKYEAEAMEDGEAQMEVWGW